MFRKSVPELQPELAVETGRLLWYKRPMRRDEIIKTLKEREADLRAHGVTHAALSGSVARGEQLPDSHIEFSLISTPPLFPRCSTMRASRLMSGASSEVPLT